MMHNGFGLKWLVAVILLLSLSACSHFSGQRSAPSISAIERGPIRIIENAPLSVDHQQVIDRYQQYLDIATDTEVKIRVAQRIATLKLQADEVAQGQTVTRQRSAQQERRFAQQAIDDYEFLLREHPNRVDNDALLYQLARAYQQLGQRSQAIRVLDTLVERYPRSPYYLEGEFRLAQLLYQVADYEQSIQAYQRVIDQGADKNRFYLSAGYLQGWAWFKQSDFDASLRAFSRVLDEEFPDESSFASASSAQQEMLNDILRVMAIMFDQQGDWRNIAQFYDEYGARHYEDRIYDRLATHYYDKASYRSAASTLRAYTEHYPLDRRSAGFYQRLIEGYQRARYPELTRRHQRAFIERFGVTSEYWQQHPDQHLELTALLADHVWQLAQFQHGWAGQTEQPQERQARLAEAAHWYDYYLTHLSRSEFVINAHFLLAEIHFEQADYPLAVHHYEIVAYQYHQHELASEAGYAAILAYRRHQPEDHERALWRQKTVTSAMRFVREFTSDERRGSVLVNTAETLLADEYYDSALNTIVLARQADGNLSARHQYGANLVEGHASFALQRFDVAEVALLKASQYRDVDAQTRVELRDKVAASIYQQGEQAQRSGDERQAIDHWLRLARVIPESRIRIHAEYDAATALMSLADYPQAIQVLNQFRQQFPNHPLTRDVPSKLIVAYEDQQQWSMAAHELSVLCESHDDAEQQRIACFQAAQYFEKDTDWDNAIDRYRSYAHAYPRPFDPALEAHVKLEQLYLRVDNQQNRYFWLNRIISLDRNAGEDRSDRSRYLAAQSAYELGEIERQFFENIRLRQPLANSIQRKNTAMQEAIRRYTQATNTDVQEFTTAATYRIAELYAELSRALMASERPRGMDELEQEEYQFLLEDQAFPLTETAIELHQTNAARTRDGLYDEWIKNSFAALAELMPGQYQKNEQMVRYVEQIR